MRSISSRFRLIRSDLEMDTTLHEPIRTETTSIYRQVAEMVCRPGMQKSMMDEKVRAALGGYPLWRVRACRLGEAGCFSAAAVHQLQTAYLAFLSRHKAQHAASAKTEQVRQAATDRDLLRRLRDQHAAELQRITARLALLDGDKP